MSAEDIVNEMYSRMGYVHDGNYLKANLAAVDPKYRAYTRIAGIEPKYEPYTSTISKNKLVRLLKKYPETSTWDILKALDYRIAKDKARRMDTNRV